MDNYCYYNKYYLLSLKPKYNLLIYFLLISIISIIICLFIFKIDDVIVTKGYISCQDKCYITIKVDTNDTNKVDKTNYIILDNNKIIPSNKDISDIKVDDITLSNYQIVNFEVNQLDHGLNTFQDVKLYSNNETIIRKIIHLLF